MSCRTLLLGWILPNRRSTAVASKSWRRARSRAKATASGWSAKLGTAAGLPAKAEAPARARAAALIVRFKVFHHHMVFKAIPPPPSAGSRRSPSGPLAGAAVGRGDRGHGQRQVRPLATNRRPGQAGFARGGLHLPPLEPDQARRHRRSAGSARAAGKVWRRPRPEARRRRLRRAGRPGCASRHQAGPAARGTPAGARDCTRGHTGSRRCSRLPNGSAGPSASRRRTGPGREAARRLVWRRRYRIRGGRAPPPPSGPPAPNPFSSQTSAQAWASDWRMTQ